jgi:tetratricopeptide (TPR) repeat protein
MRAIDVNSLFARAEQRFAANMLDDARGDLLAIQRVAGDHPAVLHLLGLVNKRRGDLAGAKSALARASALAPSDPQINSNYGNLLADIEEPQAALACYGRALMAAPSHVDARYNRALLLQRLGRLDEALADLDEIASVRPTDAKTHSARGSVLRELKRLDAAADAFDAALKLDRNRPTALHGRARVAMERGDGDASAFYRQALQNQPQNLQLVLGFAEALEAEGDPDALQVLERAVAQDPEWLDGQRCLARMRWEAGQDVAFTRDLEDVLATQPANGQLWLAYAATLADAGLHERAADAAAQGRHAAGDDVELTLMEAVQASEAGQVRRSDQLFAKLPASLPDRAILEARHRLRCREFERASQLVDKARSEKPQDIGAWALTGLIWRLTGDARAEWLLGQPGLVTSMEVRLDEGQLQRIADCLRGLHRTRAHPIGQSIRGGTQTRGRLFDRRDAEVSTLVEAVEEALERYWSSLPPRDEAHPLLRYRDSPRFLGGSWSVRLTSGGFHVSHFHPEGILSSACYLVVPTPKAPMEGWLELGGAPSELGVAIDPLVVIEPKPGRLALFPSYLFHGTRPFFSGERLTVAFDVVAK